MKIQGEHFFRAPPETVWTAVLDPRALASSLPGFQRLDVIGEHEFEGALELMVGPVGGDFQGTLKLSDLKPPSSYRFSVNGMGADGFLDGDGLLVLEGTNGGTRLHYDLNAKVGGRIAAVGEGVLDTSARAMARRTLEGLEQHCRPPRDQGSAPREAAVEIPAPAAAEEDAAVEPAAAVEVAAEERPAPPPEEPPKKSPGESSTQPDEPPSGRPEVGEVVIEERPSGEPAPQTAPEPRGAYGRGRSASATTSRALGGLESVRSLAAEIAPALKRPGLATAALAVYTIVVILITRACSS